MIANEAKAPITAEEARALARQIAKVLRSANATYIFAIEIEDPEKGPSGVLWDAGANHSSLRNMLGAAVGHVVGGAKPDGCPACDAALEALTKASDALSHDGVSRTCH